jgi:hypothetical protein
LKSKAISAAIGPMKRFLLGALILALASHLRVRNQPQKANPKNEKANQRDH